MDDNKTINNNNRAVLLYQNVAMTVGVIILAAIFVMLLYAGYKIRRDTSTFTSKVNSFNTEVKNINKNLNNINTQLKSNQTSLSSLPTNITKIP